MFSIYMEYMNVDKQFCKKKLTRNKLPEHIAKLHPCLIGLEACSTAYY